MKAFVLEKETKVALNAPFAVVHVILGNTWDDAAKKAETIVPGLCPEFFPFLRSPTNAYTYRIREVPCSTSI